MFSDPFRHWSNKNWSLNFDQVFPKQSYQNLRLQSYLVNTSLNHSKSWSWFSIFKILWLKEKRCRYWGLFRRSWDYWGRTNITNTSKFSKSIRCWSNQRSMALNIWSNQKKETFCIFWLRISRICIRWLWRRQLLVKDSCIWI